MSFMILRDVLSFKLNYNCFHGLIMFSMRQGGLTQRKETDESHADQNEQMPKLIAEEEAHSSVDPVLSLQLSHIKNDAGNIGFGQAFDRRHVAKGPVMRLHPSLRSKNKGHVGMVAGFIDFVDQWRSGPLLTRGILTVATGADRIKGTLAHGGLPAQLSRYADLNHCGTCFRLNRRFAGFRPRGTLCEPDARNHHRDDCRDCEYSFWLSLQIVWVHGMFVSNQRDK